MADQKNSAFSRTDVRPHFSNATKIVVSDDSVLMQFAYVRNDADDQLISEIILSPKHAISFSRTLDATIKKHFTKHLQEEA